MRHFFQNTKTDDLLVALACGFAMPFAFGIYCLVKEGLLAAF